MEALAERIEAVVQEAERRVLALLGEAAASGDYTSIDLARDAAQRLNQLGVRLRSVPEPPSARAEPEPQRTRKRSRYPHFSVEDGALIKTGWSKKHKTEYAQRIPREAFDLVVGVLARFATNGSSPVSSEQILEGVESEEGGLPSYQSYAVLAFLRARNVIRQVTRGSYSITPEIAPRATEAWDSTSNGE